MNLLHKKVLWTHKETDRKAKHYDAWYLMILYIIQIFTHIIYRKTQLLRLARQLIIISWQYPKTIRRSKVHEASSLKKLKIEDMRIEFTAVVIIISCTRTFSGFHSFFPLPRWTNAGICKKAQCLQTHWRQTVFLPHFVFVFSLANLFHSQRALIYSLMLMLYSIFKTVEHISPGGLYFWDLIKISWI